MDKNQFDEENSLTMKMVMASEEIDSLPETEPTDGIADVFVAIPFEKKFEPIFYAIQVGCRPLKVIRGDHILGSQSIMDQVIEQLEKCQIVVADITGQNPNVLYELGYAHALDSDRVIIISDKNENQKPLPFDISHIRTFQYTNNMKGGMDLIKRIKLEVDKIKNEKPIKRERKIINTYGTKECLRVIVDELESNTEAHGNCALLYRALPVEFTPALFREFEPFANKSLLEDAIMVAESHAKETIGNPDSRDFEFNENGIGQQANESELTYLESQKPLIELLAKYRYMIRTFIEHGAQPDYDVDRTVYGRSPSNRLFNEATCQFMESAYFTDTQPWTSDLGVTSTWNHVGFFLLGKMDDQTERVDSCLLIYSDQEQCNPTMVSIIRDSGFAESVRKHWYHGNLQHTCEARKMYQKFDRHLADWEIRKDSVREKYIAEIAGLDVFFTCPNTSCNQHLSASRSRIGETCECSACKTKIVIPKWSSR